jgi:hypothetical protein
MLDLLSPALFEIVSPIQLSSRATELARHWFDAEAVAALSESLDLRARTVGLGCRIVPASVKYSIIPFRVKSVAAPVALPASNGAELLAFFFFQIYAGSSLFLDLRESRFFRVEGENAVWFQPLPLWTVWQSDFVDGIRQLYDGFYGDNDARFEQAARALGIGPAQDVFRRAFGGARKHACEYSVAAFRSTFHEVFLRCRDARVSFHPDFITLGIAIATLYDHLESLGGSYDVAAEFQRVKGLLSGQST